MAFLVPLLAGCASTPSAPERLGEAEQRFTSDQAVLLDFAFEGTLHVDRLDEGDLTALVQAQLMFAVGQLNGDRSLGRYERLEITGMSRTASAWLGNDEVKYRARLPVAWGGSTVPAAYAFTLPARIAEQDQLAFLSKYGTTCVDPSAGSVDGGQLFIAYRPHAASCVLAPADVVTFPVAVTASTDNTTGKYPEYDRIWDDGALNIVAMFSQELEGLQPESDGGIGAYDRFVWTANEYLRRLQPDKTKRTAPPELTPTPGLAMRQVKLAATLEDGRAINVDVMLVRHRLDDDRTVFDQWYDPLTPAADVILYNGHAGLGDNVRTLMNKGTFRTGQYVVWIVNGCDTFAYVDRTLLDRRASLNADDPRGTRYMDTVSNVMPAYFETSPRTSMAFIEAIVAAGDPKPAPLTYQQIFTGIDPEQIVVVTGEEDNEFRPGAIAPGAAAVSAGDEPPAPRAPIQTASAEKQGSVGRAGCDASGVRAAGAPLAPIQSSAVLTLGCLLWRLRRSRGAERGRDLPAQTCNSSSGAARQPRGTGRGALGAPGPRSGS
jgi:hypothetical protein